MPLNSLLGPPKEPKIMAQYLKIESTGSIGSIILAILEVQVGPLDKRLLGRIGLLSSWLTSEALPKSYSHAGAVGIWVVYRI